MQQKELRRLPLLPTSLSRTLIILGIASVITMGAGILYFNRSQTTQNTPVAVPKIPSNLKVNALGRLEPRGEVIRISAPSNPGGNGSRILQLLVEQGDKVKAGQTIAILDSRDRLRANLAEALSSVEVAQSRLNQVKAGAKQGEITARQASISRLQAELFGQIQTQDAEIARLETQLQGEIATQQATVNRLEAELQGQKQTLQATVARIEAEKRNAQTEVKRFESLFKEGVISSQEVERRRLLVETSTQQLVESQANQNRAITTLQQQIQEAKANRDKTIGTLRIQIRQSKANREKTVATLQQQINEAKGTLNQTTEVRPTDIANAQAEVNSAKATVQRIQTELDLEYIRAPKTGQILRVLSRPGETPGNDGIVELAQNEQMYVVAEIYESDISKIRPGQTAKITSPSNTFAGELTGNIDKIGLQIAKKDVLGTDPTAATDARVIEVKISLDKQSSKKVANFTNLQVNVEINSGN